MLKIETAGIVLIQRDDGSYEAWDAPHATCLDPLDLLYARLSDRDDPDGDEASVDLQVRRSVARILDLGATRIRIYVDHGFSASMLTVVRPRFEEMLRDADDPRVARIWAWRADRLARRPWDGERLLRLADEERTDHRVRILTVGDGVDTDLPGGDEVLRERVKFARWEAKAIKMRTHTRRSELAGDGYWMGRVGYGHALVPDGKRKLVKVVPDEAAVIRDIAERIVAREGIVAMTKRLAAEGVTTRGGKPWQHTHLRRLITSPRLVGRVSHDQAAHPDLIEPILEQATYDAVRAILLAPGRDPGSPHDGRPRHLLTGIVRCGSCHGVLRAKGSGAYEGKRVSHQGYSTYGCIRDPSHPGACGRVWIRGDHTDAYIEGLTLAALRDGAVARNAPHEPPRDPVADARSDLDELIRQLTELELSHLAGTLETDYGVSEDSYRVYRARKLTERDEAEKRLAAEARIVRIHVAETTPDALWQEASLAQKRAILREVWEEIRILPTGAMVPRRRYWDPRRIRAVPRA